MAELWLKNVCPYMDIRASQRSILAYKIAPSSLLKNAPILGGKWAWQPRRRHMVFGLQTQPKSWLTGYTFWVNHYLEILFFKISVVNTPPPPLKSFCIFSHSIFSVNMAVAIYYYIITILLLYYYYFINILLLYYYYITINILLL